jgi:hypothetical protein
MKVHTTPVSARFITSLINRLDVLPSTTEPLLPQADLVVTGADSKNITAEGPAHTPGDGIE